MSRPRSRSTRRPREKDKVIVRGLNFYYGETHALKDVS